MQTVEVPSRNVVKVSPAAVLNGCGDLANVNALRARLTAIELDAGASVELDLHRLTFCDSRGARLLRLLADDDQPVLA